jgi:hypothetical protein
MGNENDFFPPPMRENPRGFFENVRFRRLHDRVLRQHNYSVKSFSPELPDIKALAEEHKNTMVSLVKEYNDQHDNGHWGWKDPRTSLMIDHWIYLIRRLGLRNQLRLICMTRSSKHIAKSMISRGNGKRATFEQLEKLARAYDMRFNQLVSRSNQQVMYIRYDDLIDDTTGIARIVSDYIGKEIENLDHIDPTLRRNK